MRYYVIFFSSGARSAAHILLPAEAQIIVQQKASEAMKTNFLWY